jgi:putative transposase
VLEVSRSGYYRYRQRKKDSGPNPRLLVELKAVAKQYRGCYGSRRLAKALQAQGYTIGRYATRTLMKQAGIVCQQRRRYRQTMQNQPPDRIADNTLNRHFQVPQLNQVWVADITYLWTQEGWLYIAALVDCCSRRVVGWALANHMRTELVQQALAMAIGRRRPPPGLLHHSDRGAQYTSAAYQADCQAAGITVSMSRPGNCWDNAVMERFWGTLKSECVPLKTYRSLSEARNSVIDFMECFYNAQRAHSSLGYLTPLQFEQKIAL